MLQVFLYIRCVFLKKVFWTGSLQTMDFITQLATEIDCAVLSLWAPIFLISSALKVRSFQQIQLHFLSFPHSLHNRNLMLRFHSNTNLCGKNLGFFPPELLMPE